MSEILVARRAAVIFLGDERIRLAQGTTVRAGHPLLEGREDMFEPLRVDYEWDGTKQEPKEPSQEPAQEQEQGQEQEAKQEPAPRPAAKVVRAWAAENGIDVPARGAIPDSVYEQYQAAQD